jgi:hypothetical protein
MFFGVPGFLLGCCGGLLLRYLSARCRFVKSFVVRGAIAGLAMGSAVPLPFIVLQEVRIGFLAVRAFSGLVCALLTMWLLLATRLVKLTGAPPQSAVSD